MPLAIVVDGRNYVIKRVIRFGRQKCGAVYNFYFWVVEVL
jgi:hypothetical protein